MSASWKQAIKEFLKHKDSTKLRMSLRKEWIDIYPEDKIEVYNFLYKSQQNKLFIYLFAVDLQSQIIELPWVKALKIVANNRTAIPDDFFTELITNFKKQKMISGRPNTVTELIKELKNKGKTHYLQQVLKNKQELLASARIAQSERLEEQHVHYMQELKRIAPSE